MSTPNNQAPVSIADLKRIGATTAKDGGMGNVKKFFDANKATLVSLLPKHMDGERMMKIAFGALRTTPKLAQCTIESLFGAVIQCAQLGLEPNTPLGHAFLIPFDKKGKVNGEWKVIKTEVQIVFGYKGLIDLTRRSGQIVSIAAHAVHKNDKFEYEYGLDEKLIHKPAMGERGDVIAFYAVAKLVGGGHAFEVMSRQQIEEIRDQSQGYKSAKDKADTVWGKNFVEMGRKTVLRRIFKYLPVSIELATAAALDGRADAGKVQGLDDVLTGEFTVLSEDAIGQSENEEVNTDTGEIMRETTQQAPAQITQQDHGMTLSEALAAARAGDKELAFDLMRDLPADAQAQVNAVLTPAQNTPAPQPTSTGRTRRNME